MICWTSWKSVRMFWMKFGTFFLNQCFSQVVYTSSLEKLELFLGHLLHLLLNISLMTCKWFWIWFWSYEMKFQLHMDLYTNFISTVVTDLLLLFCSIRWWICYPKWSLASPILSGASSQTMTGRQTSLTKKRFWFSCVTREFWRQRGFEDRVIHIVYSSLTS